MLGWLRAFSGLSDGLGFAVLVSDQILGLGSALARILFDKGYWASVFRHISDGGSLGSHGGWLCNCGAQPQSIWIASVGKNRASVFLCSFIERRC